MCRETGCFGSCIRIILGILNTIFLIVGLGVFISAAVLRWSSSSALKKLIDNDSTKDVIDISTIEAVTVGLLVVGGIIAFISLIGLIGVVFANRFFLVIYEIIIVLLFLTHLIIVLVLAFKSSDLEKEYRKALNKTIENINAPDTSEQVLSNDCAIMKLLSEIFECCGANGPTDFANKTLTSVCCIGEYQTGCGDKAVDSISNNVVPAVLVPNGVILGFEFIMILAIPFVIGRISREQARRRDEERNNVLSIKPTTYGQPKYRAY